MGSHIMRVGVSKVKKQNKELFEKGPMSHVLFLTCAYLFPPSGNWSVVEIERAKVAASWNAVKLQEPGDVRWRASLYSLQQLPV